MSPDQFRLFIACCVCLLIVTAIVGLVAFYRFWKKQDAEWKIKKAEHDKQFREMEANFEEHRDSVRGRIKANRKKII